MAISQFRNCFRCGTEFSPAGGQRICASCKHPDSVGPQKGDRLSFREGQVCGWVCLGKLNKEIGFELGLTEGTIKEYLNRIFRKTGVTNRTELAMWTMNWRSMATNGRNPEASTTPFV